jgi:hypothetical protein
VLLPLLLSLLLLLSLPLLLLNSLSLLLLLFERKLLLLLLLLQLFCQPCGPAACCLQEQPDTGAALRKVQVPALLQHKQHQPQPQPSVDRAS